MGFARSFTLAALAVLPSVTSAEKICYSYGVDYVDEGKYFIDSQSSDKFSSVSYFRGCNEGKADVLLIEPEGVNQDEYICDQMTTLPENEFKTSICPVQKSQMESGHWRLIVSGNNGPDGQPFAWLRDLYLTVGTVTTSTFTPTVTFSISSTPISTQTVTSIVSDVVTTGPFSTVVVATGTAKGEKTITPSPVTTTSSKILTRTHLSLTKDFQISTKTVTASCTTPGRPDHPDKPCTYTPKKYTPAALATPTNIPRLHRFIRKADRAVDIEWARARIEAAKLRRAEKARDASVPLERRGPDAPVRTVTASPVNSTTTILAPATTTTETVLTSTTVTSTLPPPTIFSGLITNTVTLPTPTKTRVSLGFTTTTKVITFGATFTKTTTVIPTSSVSACKSAGGHFWPF